jgi:hypothetical protein
LKDSNPKFDPFSFPYSNFKMETKFEIGLNRKVVGLAWMYNFGILSFLSFSIKFKVILSLPISRNCPFFISNSNFKI